MKDTTEVKILRAKNKAVLLEYSNGDGFSRVILPDHLIKEHDGKAYVTLDDLYAGIPYGVPWEDVIEALTIVPEEVAKSLRESGVWTIEDAEKNPQAVTGAVFACTRPILTQINSIVKSSHSREQGEVQ